MQFRLLYEGRIAPRQRINVTEIHEIRMQLHPQLKALWERMPLSELSTWFLREEGRGPGGRGIPILERKNNVLFAPLITQTEKSFGLRTYRHATSAAVAWTTTG